MAAQNQTNIQIAKASVLTNSEGGVTPSHFYRFFIKAHMKITIVNCQNGNKENIVLTYLNIAGHIKSDICNALSAVTQSSQWLFPKAFVSYGDGNTTVIVDDTEEIKFFGRLCDFIKVLVNSIEDIALTEQACTKWRYIRNDECDFAEIEFISCG